MIDGLFARENYTVAKKLLDATELRHRAIASNLANVETPGYRRVDLEKGFEARLRSAVEKGDMKALGRLAPGLGVDDTAKAARADGNTVKMEDELVQMDVVGPVCESADTFARARPLPQMQAGDLVAFFSAGAYGAVMASGYNSRLPVPEVMVQGDRFAIVRHRPTFQEVLRGEQVPVWLGRPADDSSVPAATDPSEAGTRKTG